MLYFILIVLLVILTLLFILPGVIMFLLIKTNIMNSGAFTETFHNIMNKMTSGVNLNTQNNQSISHQEALEILGLIGDPSKTEINKAYHKLMQSNHPDKGGSQYLAKQINSARDVLLKKDQH